MSYKVKMLVDRIHGLSLKESREIILESSVIIRNSA